MLEEIILRRIKELKELRESVLAFESKLVIDSKIAVLNSVILEYNYEKLDLDGKI